LRVKKHRKDLSQLDSKTPAGIVCQDWNEVVACAVMLRTNGFPFGQCRGPHCWAPCTGVFPLLTSGWTSTTVQTSIKGPAFSPICSQQRVSVRKREERKKKKGGKEKKGREEKRKEKKREKRKKEKEKGRRGRGKKNRKTPR
jgi:hypothetical protein